MPLYDQYQLANSTRVPIYQGSTIPELTQVSQELQRRYNTAQAGQDYLSRFMNSMQYLPKDQAEFQKWSQGYRDKLKELSSRKDLENTLRDTSILAQDLPSGYAPFAQRLKEFQTYRNKLSEAVDKGDITPETARGMLAMSLAYDQGIQKDPVTGNYVGAFNGLDYVHDINTSEFVDKLLEDAAPESEGYTRQKIGDQWIITNKHTGKKMSPERIRDIILKGAATNPQFQSWLRQKEELGTYDQDYSKLDVNDLPESFRAKAEALHLTPQQAILAYKREQIANNILQGMVDYGVNKYKQDLDVSQTYKENPEYARQRAHQLSMMEKDYAPITGGSFLSIKPESLLGSPGKIASAIGQSDQAVEMAEDALKTFASKNGAFMVSKDGKSTTGPNGEPLDPTDPSNIWYDKNGNNITHLVQPYIQTLQAAQEHKKQLKAIDDTYRREAGYTETPEDRQKKEDFYKMIYDSKLKDLQASYSWWRRPLTKMNDFFADMLHPNSPKTAEQLRQEEFEETARKEAQKETEAWSNFHNRRKPGYEKYKEILKRNAQAESVPVNYHTFNSKELNNRIAQDFANMNVNLEKGMNTGNLQWALGPDAGKMLTQKEAHELQGKAQYIGSGMGVDGKTKSYFVVGDPKLNSKGELNRENKVVQVDAPGWVRKEMLRERLENTPPEMRDAISGISGLSYSLQYQFAGDEVKSVDVPTVGGNVTVTKVAPSEVEGNVAPAGYIVSFPTTDGKQNKRTVPTLTDAAEVIILTQKRMIDPEFNKMYLKRSQELTQ